jgi:site-specific recombinase XerD
VVDLPREDGCDGVHHAPRGDGRQVEMTLPTGTLAPGSPIRIRVPQRQYTEKTSTSRRRGASHLDHRDPATIAAYRAVLDRFLTWLAQQPGGQPFQVVLLTQTAVRGYLEYLQRLEQAPRTRAKALTVLRCFGRWAVEEGLLRRNPAANLERPTVVALAPTELTPAQRFVLWQLVERAASPRLEAIVSLAYWAGLRISEIATLRVTHCDLSQRAGTLHLVEAKGGKTRTIDLHNQARRALYTYLHAPIRTAEDRDPESGYVFTSQRAAWLRRQGRPDHLSTRGIEYLWRGLTARATHDEWVALPACTFHDLRHDWAHRARAAGWTLPGGRLASGGRCALWGGGLHGRTRLTRAWHCAAASKTAPPVT